MKSNVEQQTQSNKQLKKRISSANFINKKVKSILTSRQTYDQTMMLNTNDTNGMNATTMKKITQRTFKTHNLKQKDRTGFLEKNKAKILSDFIKTNKHEKSKQQATLMKNCDKTKLIFWNNDLTIKGNQKYLILSADLIINQDSFWDKNNSDNGKLNPSFGNANNSLSVLNHNMSSTLRNKNINSYHPKLLSSTSIGSNLPFSKKNPLFQSTSINSFIGQWKSLHFKSGLQNNKLIVIWLIRKLSSYNHIHQFVQYHQLPLHAIFYTKRKRINHFFDINPIVKQIHYRFFQSIIHPKKQNPIVQPQKSVQKYISKQSKSKQFIRNENKNYSNTISAAEEVKKQFGSITNRIGIAKRQYYQYQQENDQNSSNVMNSTNTNKTKQFELSKNRQFCTTAMETQNHKNFTIKVKKNIPSSATRIRSTTIKIKNIIKQNNQLELDQIQRIKLDVTPKLQSKQKIHQQTQDTTNQNQISFTQNFISTAIEQFKKPQIFLLQGIKCNPLDPCVQQSYYGKIPLLFDHHEEKYKINKKKIEEEIKGYISGENVGNNEQIKVFYMNYETISDNVVESINGFVKGNILSSNVHTNTRKSSSIKCYQAHKIHSYQQTLISKTFQQIQQFQKSKLTTLKNTTNNQQQQQPQLTEQQQDQLHQKTQKKLSQIRKKMIDDVIAIKGRNFTFENGESIHYYVGDIFKRNYKFFYQEYYKTYEKEMVESIYKKNNNKKKTQRVVNTHANFGISKQKSEAQLTKCPSAFKFLNNPTKQTKQNNLFEPQYKQVSPNNKNNTYYYQLNKQKLHLQDIIFYQI